MTLTTVGYGDITPANDSERLYAFRALPLRSHREHRDRIEIALRSP